ncbi:MAG TPA: cell envelope integrity EipB family protein [Roseiarcus sp.]|nr:cell envelope integrity EipB family protein [Roseiarcus sp.]
MRAVIALGLAVVGLAGEARAAEQVMPFAAHRAAYMITLAKGEGAQSPVGASGMIAYEFRGSSCEGYASDFRQVTELQRAEGEATSSDTRAITFEDGQAKTLRFKIESTVGETEQPSVDGNAARAETGELSVDLKEPKRETLNFGKGILFPTQHLARVIEAAKAGQNEVEAQVYDGSDTGEKVFDTLTVVGKEATSPSPDSTTAEALKSVRRWPVTISYFDAAKKDSSPEYVLSFDLYENGVSGSLKLDYGEFVLSANLAKFELLPSSPCEK